MDGKNYRTSLREIIAVLKRGQNREAVKKYYLEHKKRFEQMEEWICVRHLRMKSAKMRHGTKENVMNKSWFFSATKL